MAGKTSPDWEKTVKYRIPALQGAIHREILHVPQNPCDIISVNMVGAIFPKDISICSVVQEIARQIDHFIRELVELTLDLKRVYEAPFHDRPGRLLLWQGSK